MALYAAGSGGNFQNYHSQNSSETSSQSLQQDQVKTSTQSAKPSGTTVDSSGPDSILLPPKASPTKTATGTRTLLQDSLSRVPWYIYVLLGAEIIFVVILGLLFILIVSSWARATLIIGVRKAIEGEEISLFDVTTAALKRTKQMAWLNAPPLLFLLFSFFMFFVLAVVASLFPPFGLIAAFILGCIGIYVFFRFSVAMVFAPRYCALENYSWQQSFETAYDAAQGNIWKTLKLLLANGLVAFFIHFVIFFPVLGFLIAYFLGVAQGNDLILGIGLVLLIVVFFFIVIPLSTLFGAFWNVFSYATLDYSFRYIKDRQKEKHATQTLK